MESIQIDREKKKEKIEIDESEGGKEFKMYDFLTDPKIVGFGGLFGILGFITMLIIAIIVGAIATPDFNIVTFTISHLGGSNTSPAPWLLDIGLIMMAIGLIPVVCYMDKLLAPYPQSNEDLQSHSRSRSRLGSLGTYNMIIGLIGIAGVGIFSVDRNPPVDGIIFDGLGLHTIISFVLMGAIVFGGIFFGLIIVLFDTMFPKIFGWYMIIVPIVPFFLLYLTARTPSTPLYEWILMFSYMGWLIPGGLIVGKHLKAERELK